MLILIWVHKCDSKHELNVNVDELSVLLLGLDQLSAAPLSLQIDNVKIKTHHLITFGELCGFVFGI